jgi:hypothetical protein
MLIKLLGSREVQGVSIKEKKPRNIGLLSDVSLQCSLPNCLLSKGGFTRVLRVKWEKLGTLNLDLLD